MQASMFNIPRVDLPKVREMARAEDGSGILGAYTLLKKGEYSTAAAVNEIVQARFCDDWKRTWSEFDSNGTMNYLKSFELNAVTFRVYELDDSKIRFQVGDSETVIFEWSEDDQFGKKMEADLRRRIKQHIYQNGAQIEHLFERYPF